MEKSGSVKIIIRMTPEKLGQFKIPILISIAGSVEPPIQALISCTCTGPKVVLDHTEVRWGNIDCLVDSTRTLKITNDSTIQATMQLFLKMARSKFELPVSALTLAPGESFDVNINANLDDSVVIKEELHVLV